jgi:fucose 4-O-acetylase-like acetyltransferase
MYYSVSRRSDNSLRGFVCILVVLFHAVGQSPESGLRLPSGTFWSDFVSWISYARMPLFAFIAGYIYSKTFPENRLLFIHTKARRLILPILTVGTILSVAQMYVPGTNVHIKDWTQIYITPLNQFWFLEAIFDLFVISTLLEFCKAFQTRESTIAVFLGSCVLYLSYRVPGDYFSISRAIDLAPFFFLGISYTRFRFPNPTSTSNTLWMLILGGGALFSLLGILHVIPRISPFWTLIVGLAVCCVAIRIDWSSNILEFVGIHSYSIFLFHVFFTAGFRIMFYHFGVRNVDFLVITLTLCGVVGPIVLKKLLELNPITNTLFLGEEWSSQRKLLIASTK